MGQSLARVSGHTPADSADGCLRSTHGLALLASISEVEHLECVHPWQNYLAASALRHSLFCSFQRSPAHDVRAMPLGKRRWDSRYHVGHSALESCYSQGDPRQGVGTCIRWQWLVKSTAVGETYDFDNLGVQHCARDPRCFAQPATVPGYLPKAALHSFGSFAESLPKGARCCGAHCPSRPFRHGC